MKTEVVPMVAALMRLEKKLKKQPLLAELCGTITSAIDRFLDNNAIRNDQLSENLSAAYGRIRPNKETAAIENITEQNELHSEIEARAAAEVSKQPAKLPRSNGKIAEKEPKKSMVRRGVAAFKWLIGRKKNANHDQQDSKNAYVNHESTKK